MKFYRLKGSSFVAVVENDRGQFALAGWTCFTDKIVEMISRGELELTDSSYSSDVKKFIELATQSTVH